MKYRTIVADPPWEYPAGWPTGSSISQAAKRAAARGEAYDSARSAALPYRALSVEEICRTPVASCADHQGCHLYLWTTAKYLRDAFRVIEAWGFRYACPLIWAKTPMGIGPGGTWASNTEFVLVGRRGNLRHLRRFDTRWWNWPRMGNAHSRKPEAFLDMVEEASPGPYLELFARRQRLGWDTWGDEALEHVELVS